MFYIVIFTGLAVLLIIAFITVGTRRRRDMENYERNSAEHNSARTKATRRERNAERKQSRTARRKRH